jgi:hypothetical protein
MQTRSTRSAAEELRHAEARRAPLVLEDRPSFYVYRLHMGTHVQAGIAACFSVDEYDAKSHQEAREDPARQGGRPHASHAGDPGADRAGVPHLPASAAVDAVVARVTAGAPLFDFTAPDGVRHLVWQVPEAEHDRDRAGLRGGAGALHRRRSPPRGQRVARPRRYRPHGGRGRVGPRVLAVAFPDDPDAGAALQPGGARPQRGTRPNPSCRRCGPVSVCARDHGDANRQGPGRDAAGRAVVHARRRGGGSAADRTALDVDVSLEREVLAAAAGHRRRRTDTRIEFVGGIRGTAELERLVDSAPSRWRSRCSRSRWTT